MSQTNQTTVSVDGLVPGSSAWEQRCKRCGRCCHEKIEFEGEIYYTDTPCEMLDTATRLCTVYERRLSLRPGCAALSPELARRGFLPADCPYVEGLKDYRPPHLWPDKPSCRKKNR